MLLSSYTGDFIPEWDTKFNIAYQHSCGDAYNEFVLLKYIKGALSHIA